MHLLLRSPQSLCNVQLCDCWETVLDLSNLFKVLDDKSVLVSCSMYVSCSFFTLGFFVCINGKAMGIQVPNIT